MANEPKRIIDQPIDLGLSPGDMVMVDSQGEGTRQFDLGTALNDIDGDITDVKADIEELQQDSGGWSDTQKALLITILRNGLYSTDQSDNIDTLEQSFSKNVISISAVFDSGGNTIYSDDTLETLKQYLTVTASYDDETSGTVSTYTLSGTLAVGTSTITVEYGGATTSFTVTVEQAVVRYTITNNLTDVTNSNTDTSIADGNAYTATLSTAEGYEPSDVSVTMGGTDVTSTAYDSSDYSISIASVTGNLVITAVAAEKEIWSDGTHWYDGVPYSFDVGITKDVYIGNSGQEVAYNGWDASDYMNCEGATSITAYHTRTPECAFYDSSKTFVSRFTLINSANQEQVMNVPSNAAYFRISWATEAVSSPSKLGDGYYIKPNA